MKILRAETGDLETILDIQRNAFAEEAARYGKDCDMPPSSETLGEASEAMKNHAFFKAVSDCGDILGAVRCRMEGGVCTVLRLCVRPEARGRGVASALVAACEAHAAGCGCETFALFTGHKSFYNMRLYRRLGYGAVRMEKVSPCLNFVHMQKRKIS